MYYRPHSGVKGMATQREPRKTIITLRVAETEEREFRLLARAQRQTMSEMIRQSVRESARRLAKGGES